jgi:hypothetical protein
MRKLSVSATAMKLRILFKLTGIDGQLVALYIPNACT